MNAAGRWERAKLIKQRREAGAAVPALAFEFGVCVATVWKALRATEPVKHQRVASTRDQEIAYLRKSGLTLQVIGDLYGLSEEAIRLVLLKQGITGRLSSPPKPARALPKNFAKLIRRWLHQTGWAYCSFCHQAKAIQDFMPSWKPGVCCRACNRDRALEYRAKHQEHWRAWNQNYHKQHKLARRKYEWRRRMEFAKVGLCEKCGGQRDSKELLLCSTCRAKNLQRYYTRKEEKQHAEEQCKAGR